MADSTYILHTFLLYAVNYNDIVTFYYVCMKKTIISLKGKAKLTKPFQN